MTRFFKNFLGKKNLVTFKGIHAEASDDDDDENQSLEINSYLWNLLPDKGMYWFK